VTIDGVRAVLLDIEGTTTPIAFVHDRLFSYAKANVRAFLDQVSLADSHIASILNGLREEYARDLEQGETLPPWSDDTADSIRHAASSYACWLMERDRKSGPLKALQGLIWERGYTSGVLRGQVYPDVSSALRLWTEAGIVIGIFSSGSVLAQKLLFTHSNAGDLTPFLTWHFDTAVGPKRDPESYRRIAAQMGMAPADILFMSDTPEELDAALAAGFRVVRVERGESQSPPSSHPVVTTFDHHRLKI
jgi:enolase-phosphatase E1